jgi:ribosome-associated toxin RatA of RatAB toxin-antitoxin module
MKQVSVVVITVFLWLYAVAAAAPVPLSMEQRGRLQRGDVVVLDVLPPGEASDVQGGTAVALVRAAPEIVWAVLLDFANHAGLYPRVTASRVLQSDPMHTLVRYVVSVGPLSFGFHVNNYPDPLHRRLVWQLAVDRRNDLFRKSWGYWQLDPDPGGVQLTYAMAASTVLPGFVTRSAERDGLLATVSAVRDRAEHRALSQPR